MKVFEVVSHKFVFHAHIRDGTHFLDKNGYHGQIVKKVDQKIALQRVGS